MKTAYSNAIKERNEANLLTFLSDIIPDIKNVIRVKEWWKPGTRSVTQRYSNKNDPNSTYLVKIIRPEFKEEAITEIAVDEVFKKDDSLKDIYCNLKGYKYLDKSGYYLVFDVERQDTLTDQYRNQKEINSTDLIRSFDPVNLLHRNEMNHKEEIEKNLREMSQNEILGLDSLSPKRYAAKFLRYANQKKKLDKSEIIKLMKSFESLASENIAPSDTLINKRLIVLGPHDGYSWNGTEKHLFDRGDFKVIARAFHLGCRYGDHHIFSKLKNKRENISELCQHYSLVNNLQEEKDRIEKGFYLSAAYANYRLTWGNVFSEEEKSNFRKTSLEQLMILGEKSPEAKEIHNILKNTG
jgi:hypothetical protein